MFTGTFPAIPTPFSNGGVDEDACRRLVAWVVDNGVEGIVACGTTGEAPTLTPREWARVVEICVASAGGLPVIAGTGTNDTRAAVERTRQAAELGAAGALVVVPYYNKPTREGMKQHFRAVARDGGLPVILYNVPSRTGVNMTPDTVVSLSLEQGIVAVKEASGSLDQASAILAGAAPGFAVLSGDDSLSLPLYALGGHGAISTTAAVAPRQMSDMYRAFAAGDSETARRLHFDLFPLFGALFAETNPQPAKYALSRLGIAANELRLPMVPVAPATAALVDSALELRAGRPGRAAGRRGGPRLHPGFGNDRVDGRRHRGPGKPGLPGAGVPRRQHERGSARLALARG